MPRFTAALLAALLAACTGTVRYGGCFGAEEWLPAPPPRVRSAAIEVMRALHYEPRADEDGGTLISRPRMRERPAEYPFYFRLKERAVLELKPETTGTRVKLALLGEGLGTDGWVALKTNQRRDYDRFLDMLRERLGLQPAAATGAGGSGRRAPSCRKPRP